jgi:hypothetical protein
MLQEIERWMERNDQIEMLDAFVDVRGWED